MTYNYPDPHAQWCKERYAAYMNPNSSLKSVALMFALIVLAAAVEVVVHLRLDANLIKRMRTGAPSSGNASPDHELPSSSEEAREDIIQPLLKLDDFRSYMFDADPSRSVRANRLVAAIFLIIPVCVAFGFRIDSAINATFRVPSNCHRHINVTPNWWIINFFDIMPFVVACMALLRAFTDCMLVRWGKTLQYWNWEPKFWQKGLVWPVCAPLTSVVMLVVFVVVMVREGAVWLMGLPDMDKAKGRSEEAEGLLGNADHGDDGLGFEGPPAYDVVCNPRNSV